MNVLKKHDVQVSVFLKPRTLESCIVETKKTFGISRLWKAERSPALCAQCIVSTPGALSPRINAARCFWRCGSLVLLTCCVVLVVALTSRTEQQVSCGTG